MTLEEINECLQNNVFIEEVSGQKYRFIGETMNVNGTPVTFYSIEEKDGQFYIRHEKPLITTNPMLIRVKNNDNEIRIDIVDQMKGKLFCTLISQKN